MAGGQEWEGRAHCNSVHKPRAWTQDAWLLSAAGGNVSKESTEAQRVKSLASSLWWRGGVRKQEKYLEGRKLIIKGR